LEYYSDDDLVNGSFGEIDQEHLAPLSVQNYNSS